MLDFEKNIKENAKKLAEKQRERIKNKESENKEKPKDGFNRFKMNKLTRYSIKYDTEHLFIPMHDYKLSWEIKFHDKDVDGNFTHVFCTEPVEEGSCEICKRASQISKDSVLEVRKTAWKFKAKDATAMVAYFFNTVGQKREFTNNQGELIKYFLNPAQVLEINSYGADGKQVLASFSTADQFKKFNGSIWNLHLQKKDPDNGVDGGFRLPPTTKEPEEVTEMLGTDGFEPVLPDYAQHWVNMIREMQIKKDPEKDARVEVLRYILTSFNNGESAAKLLGLELPKKEFKKKEDDELPV